MDRTHKPLFTKKVQEEALKKFEIPDHNSKFQSFKEKITRLEIKKYITDGKDPSKHVQGVEEKVKNKIVNVILDILGFDIQKDTDFETSSGAGSIDISLRYDGKSKALIEVKTWKKDLDALTPHTRYKNAVDQGLRYAYDSGIPWVIITNGCEWRLYKSFVEGESTIDFYETFNLQDLSESEFKKFYFLCSKEAFIERLDTLFNKTELRLKQIDKHILDTLLECRTKLLKDISKNNEIADVSKLKEDAQRILDRILFIRYAEDRGFFDHGSKLLKEELKKWRDSPIETRPLVEIINNSFRFVDQGNPKIKFDGYNGDLFKRHPSEDLKISDDVLEFIIESLYYDDQKNPLDFSEIDADIIGGMYEKYLGYALEVKEKEVEEVPDNKARKKLGQYYTPKYIVDYIVENTIGAYFKENGLTRDNLLGIKVLDPACGSGAFLIRAYDMLRELYAVQYNEDIEKAKKEGGLLGYINGGVISQFNRVILKENLHGVDLNDEAVEITKMNLWFRSMQKGKKLNELHHNILVGNSLINDPDIARDKAFDWKKEFAEVMDRGGFDVVIGNPPYGLVFDETEKKYLEEYCPTFKRNNDLYIAFIQKSIELLKNKGYFSFIVPNTYLTGPYFIELRKYIMAHCKILKLLDFGILEVFDDPNVFNSIILLQKEEDENLRLNNQVELIEVTSTNLTSPESFVIEKKAQYKVDIELWKPINKIVKKLEDFDKIDDYFHVKDVGFNYWTKGRGKKRGGDSIGNRVFYTGVKKDNRDIPFLKGGDIKRYYLNFGNHFLIHNYEGYLDKEKDILRYTPDFLEQKKIIYRQTANRIIATVDYDKFYTDKTVHLVVPKDGFNNNIDLKYVLSILNSNLMLYFYRSLVKEEGRAFAQVKTFRVKKIPFKKISKSEQQLFVELADKMLSLNKELNALDSDFEKYVSSMPHDFTTFEYWWRKIGVSNIVKPSEFSSTRGKIKNLTVSEANGNLIIRIEYVPKDKVPDAMSLKCKVEDQGIRAFIHHALETYGKNLGSGNLLKKLLSIKIPRYSTEEDKNKKIIGDIMSQYIEVAQKVEALRKEIQKTDNEIDARVFKLYNLEEKEVLTILKSLEVGAAIQKDIMDRFKSLE